MISTVILCTENTLILSIASLYIVLCPFQKVEESFNTQAVHDIINLWPSSLPHPTQEFQEVAIRDRQTWDHIQYPGVVPRTFLGALAVGLPMKLAKHIISGGFFDKSNELVEDEEHDITTQLLLQIGSRFALASLVVLSLSSILRAIHKRYGLYFRLSFLLVTISQFHYLFYAGRFIPNTFAAILANLIFASWINRQFSKSIIYIAICVVIFRADTAIFFGLLLIDAVFLRRQIPLTKVLQIGIPSGLASVMVSFVVDSIFWCRPVLPELEGLYFNLWLNKSHNWGTEPYTWYLYSGLPRLLMTGCAFVIFANWKVMRDYILPTLAFILTYSLLPHKELRFILFVTPLLNICVTSGLMTVFNQISRIFKYRVVKTILCSLVMLVMLTANIFGCFVMSRASSHNYPGGQAALSLGMTRELLVKSMETLRSVNLELPDPRSSVAVYVDNLAAQTGMSRFLQVNGAYYSKSPKLNESTFKKSYELIYLILEPNEVKDFVKKHCPDKRNLEKLAPQEGFESKRRDSEIQCKIPNQPNMYCSIIDTIAGLTRVNIGGLKAISSFRSAIHSTDDNDFFQTAVALQILRCSIRSKFNPFD